MIPGRSKNLMEGLAKNEKTFQEKMRNIYRKYDHAFEDDIVINLFDFTCSAPGGPVPWDCSPKATGKKKPTTEKTPENVQYSTFIQSSSIDDGSSDGLEDDPNTTCLFSMETSDGNLSRTFIIEDPTSDDTHEAQLEHSEHNHTTGNLSPPIKRPADAKETCFLNGHSPSLMPSTCSNFGNRTFFVSPLDTSVSMQIKSFSKRQKDHSFEDTRDFSYNNYQLDVSRFQYCRETAYTPDTSLGNYYPDMVECIRRLWELPWKKRAADNIVLYYKRHVRNAHKKLSSKQMFHRQSYSGSINFHLSKKFETSKECSRYKHTLSPSKAFKESSFMESAGHSPGNKTFIVNSTKNSTYLTMDNVSTKQKKVDTYEIGSCKEDQIGQFCSMFPLIKSPKTKSKVACSSVADNTIILEKAITYQSQMETDYATSSSCFNNIGQLSEVTCSFSAFPVLKSPRMNTVVLSPSMHHKTSYESATMQNQEDSYMTDTFYIKEPDWPTLKYKKRQTLDFNSSFEGNFKWLPKVANTPPKTSPSVKLKCRLTPKSTFLNNTFTCQDSVEVDDDAYQKGLKNTERAISHQELTRHFLKTKDSLPRSPSFTTLPEAYNPVRQKTKQELTFDIHRMQNQNAYCRSVQSSEMLRSLVNSPGSQRFKRRASSNFSFSTLKRQKSADETFILGNNARSSTGNSSLVQQKTTDHLQTYSPKFSGWS